MQHCHLTHFAQWQITDISIFRPFRLSLPPPAPALGKKLTHSQSDIRRSLNLDIEGLVSNKMRYLSRRDLEGALSLFNCYCNGRTEEGKHWYAILKSEYPVYWKSAENKKEEQKEGEKRDAQM